MGTQWRAFLVDARFEYVRSMVPSTSEVFLVVRQRGRRMPKQVLAAIRARKDSTVTFVL